MVVYVFSLPVCESGHDLHVGWTDRVGIGPEQGGYHPAVGSAVHCDNLALKRRCADADSSQTIFLITL